MIAAIVVLAALASGLVGYLIGRAHASLNPIEPAATGSGIDSMPTWRELMQAAAQAHDKTITATDICHNARCKGVGKHACHNLDCKQHKRTAP